MECHVPVGWTCKFESVMNADQSLAAIGLVFTAFIIIPVIVFTIAWYKDKHHG